MSYFALRKWYTISLGHTHIYMYISYPDLLHPTQTTLGLRNIIMMMTFPHKLFVLLLLAFLNQNYINRQYPLNSSTNVLTTQIRQLWCITFKRRMGLSSRSCGAWVLIVL